MKLATIVAYACFATALFLILLLLHNAHSTRRLQPSPISSGIKPAKPVNPEPLLAKNLWTNPYFLTKNPYYCMHKLVVMRTNTIPVMSGTSATPQPIILYYGSAPGLSFNRMVSPDIALYDVEVISADDSGQYSIGQIAVMTSGDIQSGIAGQLDTLVPWEVEPMGVLEGTNYVGAAIQIPEVVFYRYHRTGPRRADGTLILPK